MISVIVPAYNEEAWLGATLDGIRAAAAHLHRRSGVEAETIVVDNDSTDGTAAVAWNRGATVVHEPVQSIGRARNTGARHASGEVLVFVDADVHIPRELLRVIHETMRDPRCLGGGVDTEHHPRHPVVRLHLQAWRALATVIPLVQGATQFCRRSAFDQAGGYPEDVWMGEDTDFYAELRSIARRRQGSVRLIRTPRVRPSSRRFDQWPLWKTLVWTNPLFIAVFRRWKGAWPGWYSRLVR